jgi:hypothetical protein
MRRRDLAIGLLGGALAAAGLAIGLHGRPGAPVPVPPPASSPRASDAAAPMPALGASRVGGAPAAVAPAHAAHAPDGRAWDEFRARFGTGLARQVSGEGYVTAVRGAPGKGVRAEDDFKPTDEAAALSRAREVLAGAHELLELDPRLPLADTVTRTGPVSAQVYFRETWQGVPIEPSGGVLVDLGPQGELLGIDADYEHGLKVTGARRLGVGEARAAAESALTDAIGGQGPLAGGRAVVWVTHARREPGTPATGRPAYVYDAGGREVVVDAETGQVLESRDRRQF